MKLWHKLLLILGILLLTGGGIFLFNQLSVQQNVQQRQYHLEWATYYEAKATEAQQLADVYWNYYVYWDYYSREERWRKMSPELKRIFEAFRELEPPKKPPPILERIELPPSQEDAKYKSDYYSQLAKEYRAEAYRYRALAQQ